MKYYILAIKKYFDFDTRSTRSEYWVFFLFNVIFSIIVGSLDAILGIVPALSFLYMALIFIPGISISVRRMHDTGRSGFWILISLIPFIGGIWFFILLLLDSQPMDNKYGPNPKQKINQ